MLVTKSCENCGDSFETARRDRRFCSPACRKASWRGVPAVERPSTLPGPIVRETRALLAKYGVDDANEVARAALRCAAAMDDPNTPAAALVGLSKALPESMRYLRGVYSKTEEEA